MKKKRANISFVLLVSLVVLFAGAAILAIASNGKYNSKSEYKRLENRYIAESGIDLAAGLFVNYLDNQDYVLPYTKNADGSVSITDEYTPYLIDEIRTQADTDSVKLDLIDTETADYLASIGYLDFKRGKGIEVLINIFGLSERFKLSQICTEPDFLLDQNREGNKRSKIRPIYLTVKSTYKGGEVISNIIIENIYAVRKPYLDLQAGETGSVSAWLDTSAASIIYDNYQNYRRNE